MDLNYFFKVFNSPNIIFSRITKYANTLYGFTENDNYYSVFSDGLWENKNFENFRNITSVTEFDKGLFFGSETMGIFESWVLTAMFYDYTEGWIELFKEAGYTGDWYWTIIGV